jgi:outer membrane protein TolC
MLSRQLFVVALVLLSASVLGVGTGFAQPAPPAGVGVDAGDVALDLSVDGLLTALLEGNADVRRARYAVEDAALGQRAMTGLFDPLVGAELDLNRTAVPTQSGLSSGLSVSERYGVSGSLSQRFAPGTQVTVGLSSAITRSRFPFRASLGSNALIELLASGVAFDDALDELGRLQSEQVTQTIVDGPNAENALSLTLTQPLLRGFGSRVSLVPRALAAATFTLRERELLQRASVAAVEALTGYSELRYAYEEHALRERALERTQRQLEISEAELAAGQIAPIELDLVRQQIAVNQEALLIARDAITRRSRELHRLLGAEAATDGLIRPSDPIRDPIVQPFGPEDCATIAAQSPEVAVAVQQVELAREQLPESEDAVRAQLDARVNVASTGLDENYGASWGDVFRFRGTAVGAGLVFSTPLGNRSARAERERAELSVDRAEFEVAVVADALCYQLRDALDAAALLVARREVAAYRVEIAGRAYDAEIERFAQGMSTVQLGIDALQNLEEAEIAFLRVRTDTEIAAWQAEQLRGEIAARLLVSESGS